MCCETLSISPQKGLFGGIRTTLSAVYVPPKWLVWADSNGRSDVTAGASQLSQIDVRDCGATAQYSITPAQGRNIRGAPAPHNFGQSCITRVSRTNFD